MRSFVARWIVIAACVAAGPRWTHGQDFPELKVHLAQANNNSPYSFVRAKFEPGEVSDPWAVRFFDEKGEEIPYFVWDSVTWEVAREGRPDWGHRYALVNHAPGCAPEVLAARGRKLQWAKENLPGLGAKLEAQDEAAIRAASGDIVIGNRTGLATLYRVPVGKGQLIYIGWDVSASLPHGRQPSTVEQEISYEQQMRMLLNVVDSIIAATER